MITITTADVLGSTSYVTEILNDLKPIILMLGGLYISFYVISKIIEFVRLERDPNYFSEESDEKYLSWGRKIDEQVNWYKDQNFSDETIKTYLQKCADFREKNLDPNNLTDYEKKYTSVIEEHFRDYDVEGK